MGYHTIGRFAIGMSALGKSFGDEVKVLSDTPGPHRIKAWRPGEGCVACGIVGAVLQRVREGTWSGRASTKDGCKGSDYRISRLDHTYMYSRGKVGGRSLCWWEEEFTVALE